MAQGFTIKSNNPKLYKLEEEETIGWYVVEENLTQERCKELYDQKLNEGINPRRLRITRTA